VIFSGEAAAIDATTFGPRLKELREQGGLSQKALADKAGVSQNAVSHWEQGLREPSWSNILALSQALGVTCEAFTTAPEERPTAGRGRPRKTSDTGAEKKQRRRK
jgi:transcriptional regulator with XRE-family HTH domain